MGKSIESKAVLYQLSYIRHKKFILETSYLERLFLQSEGVAKMKSFCVRCDARRLMNCSSTVSAFLRMLRHGRRYRYSRNNQACETHRSRSPPPFLTLFLRVRRAASAMTPISIMPDFVESRDATRFTTTLPMAVPCFYPEQRQLVADHSAQQKLSRRHRPPAGLTYRPGSPAQSVPGVVFRGLLGTDWAAKGRGVCRNCAARSGLRRAPACSC